jgi:hypothetical protein
VLQTVLLQPAVLERLNEAQIEAPRTAIPLLCAPTAAAPGVASSAASVVAEYKKVEPTESGGDG